MGRYPRPPGIRDIARRHDRRPDFFSHQERPLVGLNAERRNVVGQKASSTADRRAVDGWSDSETHQTTALDCGGFRYRSTHPRSRVSHSGR